MPFTTEKALLHLSILRCQLKLTYPLGKPRFSLPSKMNKLLPTAQSFQTGISIK